MRPIVALFIHFGSGSSIKNAGSYLFILGQEVQSRMLGKELRDGNISGAKPSIRGPDIVLFSKATRNVAKRLADCLEKYCTWSRQSINRGKSVIFFSKYWA